MAWVPHSQALKSRSKDRERGTYYQEWFCPFLDNELLNNVCDNLEVHNCLSAPLLIPQIQELPSHTHKSRDKDMDWWTCYQEQLSPFLNDEKLNNVGEDLGVHKGLDAPFSTYLCPRNRGRGGGYHTRNIFALFSIMKPSKHGWRIWGVMIGCAIPNFPNPGTRTLGYVTGKGSAPS